MNKNISLLFLVINLLITSSLLHAQQPSVEEFKKTFEAHLQKLKPEGFTQRTVRFGPIVKGTANGGYYPFKVTAYIHDYGPGYPANRYYGQSCVGKMDGWKFDMRKDDFGDWIVQGRFTITGADRVCKENPSEGAEAMPLASVPGTAYQPGETKGADEVTAKGTQKTTKTTGNLYIGEYACYGYGGQLLAGMGFQLKPNGRYTDLDGARSGNYVYDAAKATISFKGGFMGGQVGKNVKNTGFQLSNTVHAEPWR